MSSLVRYRDYSVPTAYGRCEVRGYVHEVVIPCGSEIIAGLGDEKTSSSTRCTIWR